MKLSIFILLPLIFLGCNSDDVQRTKELNKDKLAKMQTISNPTITKDEKIEKLNNQKVINLEKIKRQNRVDLAKIDAQKEQKLKELELKIEEKRQQSEIIKAKVEANKSISIANIKNSANIKIKEEQTSFYKVAIIILAIVFAILAILKYLSSQAKRRQEIELKEKEHQHEAYMQELKLKHESLNKMLDILKDENSDKELKKSITKILERGKGNFIEYKNFK